MVRRELWVGTALVGIGVALRLTLKDIPNFAPVAAIALFSGYYFRSRIAAALVPMAIMTISDRQLGGYNGLMMISVYAGLALPVFFGRPLRRWLPLDGKPGVKRGVVRSQFALLGSAALASIAFFLITNFATWYSSGMYTRTSAGLAQCYLAGLPFFRWTFAGDAFFSVTAFGLFALGCGAQRSAQAARSLQAANVAIDETAR